MPTLPPTGSIVLRHWLLGLCPMFIPGLFTLTSLAANASDGPARPHTVPAAEPAGEWLEQWVRASRGVRPPDRQVAQARFGGELSAHQLDVAILLWAPPSVELLQRRFDWTGGDQSPDHPDSSIVLIGRARDPIERAFFEWVEVRLSRSDWRTTSVRFENSPTTVRFAMRLVEHDSAQARQAAYYSAQSSASGQATLAVSQQGEPRESAIAQASATGTVLQTAELPEHRPSHVDQLLEAWIQADSMMKSVEVVFSQFQYDHTFHVETRARGTLRSDGAGTVEIRIEPMPVELGIASSLYAPDGTTYQLREATGSAWVWTPTESLIVDPVDGTMVRVVHAGSSGRRWSCPLTNLWPGWFLLPAHAAELHECCRWRVSEWGDSTVVLRGEPRTEPDRRSMRFVEVLPNHVTGQPRAVKFVEVTGNETVLVVSERRSPADLTRERILEPYADFTPFKVIAVP